jgi:hypothetical protein
MKNALLAWVRFSTLNVTCCKWLVFVWEMDCVICEVGSQVLYTFYVNVSHQIVAATWRHSYRRCNSSVILHCIVGYPHNLPSDTVELPTKPESS